MTKDRPISDLKQWSWLPPWKTDCSARITAGTHPGDPWSILLVWSKSLMIQPHFGLHWHFRSPGPCQTLVSQPSSHAACVRAVLWLSSELFSTQLPFSSPLAYPGISGPYSYHREAKLNPSLPKHQRYHLHITMAVLEARWHFLRLSSSLFKTWSQV